MTKCLVVVESPAKAKTIEKYLGKDYQVLASYGHVRDLPAKKGSVLPEDHFKMIYAPIEKNSKHIDAIAKALRNSSSLLLATDPDREGEAISWHIFELMKDKSLLKDKTVHRIFFNEITKDAIKQAIEHPREIAMDLVHAQQARRALDYLVGFNLSPLLWKKVRRGLSAGRVQSPALRLIVEREEEIERFVAQEYWKITAKCEHTNHPFEAKLTYYNKEKLQQFSIQDESNATNIRKQILAQTNHKLTVKHVEKKERLRKPAPPFITSTLQQEASRKLGFTARKTMMVAQQLYEGIEIDSETAGLISYMRTDSVHLAAEAVTQIRAYVEERYGKSFCPEKIREYQTKSKNAQEAHEAIRPTMVELTPEKLSAYLTPDQLKLYSLIWKRTLASQMTDAILDTVAVDLQQHPDHMFRANGSTIRFPGFLSVYEEGKDDQQEEDGNKTLPAFEVGQVVTLLDLLSSQHFTEPPPRYSEATLVKALEECDIGRPSTYAAIIHTLQHREYVNMDKKRFVPTDIGRIVNRFLTEHFTKYVDYQFTAGLEDTLDAIARGEQAWVPVLEAFWKPFIEQIHNIETNVQRKDVTTEMLDTLCPKCNSQLMIRLGKRGRFIGCSAYPECDFTEALNPGENEPTAPEIVEGRTCPDCEHPLQIKSGKYGRFIGCTQYPTCKFIEPLQKPVETGITCPKCTAGQLVEKRSRRGKVFYSCNTYPKCNYALWYAPVEHPCPQCHWPIMMLKEGKRLGRQLVCPQEECKHSMPADNEVDSKE
jgi:DNA topoisomerase-1